MNINEIRARSEQNLSAEVMAAVALLRKERSEVFLVREKASQAWIYFDERNPDPVPDGQEYVAYVSVDKLRKGMSDEIGIVLPTQNNSLPIRQIVLFDSKGSYSVCCDAGRGVH